MSFNKILWLLWGLISLSLLFYLAYPLVTEKNTEIFLVGETSHGHHQIELSCSSCHVEPFGGPELIQSACLDCHASELKESKDSHPKSKFTDPRNADRVEILDARECITCHTEHNKEITGVMGLTLPDDYCFRCHEDVGEERETHKDLDFESCASAGCHNYHDNTALYEDFLLKHRDPNVVTGNGAVFPRTSISQLAKVNGYDLLMPEEIAQGLKDLEGTSIEPDQMKNWHGIQHAKANVGCNECHDKSSEGWEDFPSMEVCKDCHTRNYDSFVLGKHGMRLPQQLPAMRVADARLPMKKSALHKEVNCVSCHNSHEFDTVRATTDACLVCHDSEHVNNYWSSPHGALQKKVIAGEIPEEQGVSCATCHMPREEITVGGQKIISVNHNQNENLRPNEKMIRPVCMSCHSLSFSIDALADEALLKSNFTNAPSAHIRSIDMAIERESLNGASNDAY